MKAPARAALVAVLLGVAGMAGATAPADPVAAAAASLTAAAGPHRLLLLGEMHGTREAPQLAAQLASGYAQEGPVLVVLELSRSIDAALQAYLASDGGAAARQALLADAYWHKPKAQSDGRRNLEVVDLLEHLRRLRAQGRDVSVLAMDLAVGEAMGSEDRDLAMARRLRAAFQSAPKRTRVLVVCGNVHAMKARPSFAPPEMQTPMGSRLLDLDPYAVNLMAQAGAYWACINQVCDARAVQAMPAVSGPDGSGAYDYRIVLPRYTVARMSPE